MAVLGGRARRAAVTAAAMALAATAMAAAGADGAWARPGQEPPPAGISVYPAVGLADGDEVEATLGAPRDYTVITQCRASVGTAPDLTTQLDNCGNAVLPAAGGPLTLAYTVRSSFTVASGSGDVVTCGLAPNDCLVSVSGLAGSEWTAVPIDMAPAPVRATPDRHLEPGTTVDVTVAGDAGAAVTVAQCLRPVAATREASRCGPAVPATVGSGGTAAVPLVVAAEVPAPTTADEPTACRATNCAVAAFAADGARIGDWPIALATPPVTVALDRTTGLLDGDRVLVEAAGLDPGGEYVLLRCIGVDTYPSCEFPPSGPTIVASSAGRLAVSTTVAQRFTGVSSPFVCRTTCGIAVASAADLAPLAVAGYELATGSFTASPATGLADGQAVTLTGADLMAGYEGPPVWVLPVTGQWVLGQCAADITEGPTIADVFRRCDAVPGVGVVDVPVSEATVTAPARAALTTFLDEDVDCTAAPGACVLALLRVEQDGTVSLHAAPISFA